MSRRLPRGFPQVKKNTHNVKFRPETDLVLKNTVSGNVGTKKRTPCINELIEMLDCMKRSGFVDTPCTNAIRAYKTCNKQHKEKEEFRQHRADEDLTLIANSRDMGKEQIKKLLKNFPVK